MPLPVLDYSNSQPARRWVAKAIAVAMGFFGLLQMAVGFYTVCWPGYHTAYDTKIIIHNAWVRVLFGAVLTIPAGCFVLGWVRDTSPPEVPPGG